MSGHNKWSKIKHKKGATDAKRSKEFSKVARLLTLESKVSGGDKNSPSLRVLIEKARSINMPNDNIDRAVDRGSGINAKDLNDVEYEAYGVGGVAIVILCLTDNKNRSAAEVKHILSKHNSSLATPGASMWNFEKSNNEIIPKIFVPTPESSREPLEKLSDALLELDDVQEVIMNAQYES